MNVLLLYPAFPRTFFSYDETCRMLGVKTLMPPLGLITMAALLPKDWHVELVDLNAEHVQKAQWDRADLVMIGGMITQYDGMLELAAEAKKRGKKVAMGGPFSTSVPEPFKKLGCDYMILGEAEITIPMFLKALEQGKESGEFITDEWADMTKSPMPRYDLLNMAHYDVMPIQTSRGCPFNCEFCDIVHLYGRTMRNKKPERVIDELQMLLDLGWGGRHVMFVDDNFIGHRKRVMALLKLLIPWMKENGFPYGYLVQASINLGNDRELIDLMTEANIGEVFIGVETPDEDVLKQTHKYHNTTHSLLGSLNNINENGLPVLGSFIMGFDGERSGMGDRICQFVEMTGMPVVMLNKLHILPNTKLWDRLVSENRLILEKSYGGQIKPDLNFIPTRPEREVLTEFIDTWDYLYEPSRFMARAYRYVMAMRPTRATLAKERGEEVPKPTTKQIKPPFMRRMRELKVFFHLAWRRGLWSRHLFQFWSQLIKVYRKNPSRFIRYIETLAVGENLFIYRKEILGWRKMLPAPTLETDLPRTDQLDAEQPVAQTAPSPATPDVPDKPEAQTKDKKAAGASPAA